MTAIIRLLIMAGLVMMRCMANVLMNTECKREVNLQGRSRDTRIAERTWLSSYLAIAICSIARAPADRFQHLSGRAYCLH
jgi:hypothetical protein